MPTQVYKDGGATFWNGNVPDNAIPDVTMLSAYRRRPNASMLTNLATYLADCVTNSRSMYICSQDCVPGSGRLVPTTVPVITLSDGTVVPDYNSQSYRSWFQEHYTAIKNIHQTNNPGVPLFVQWGFGKYNEGHGAGSVTPTEPTINALLSILYGLFSVDRIMCITDSTLAIQLHDAMGGDRFVRHSLGDIESPSHFRKPWVNTATAAIMAKATTVVYVEPIRYASSLARFSVTRAREQFDAYPQIRGVANGNGDFSSRTQAERDAYKAILELANTRAVAIVDTSSELGAQLTAANAQIASLNTQLNAANTTIAERDATIATRDATITSQATTIGTQNTALTTIRDTVNGVLP